MQWLQSYNASRPRDPANKSMPIWAFPRSLAHLLSLPGAALFVTTPHARAMSVFTAIANATLSFPSIDALSLGNAKMKTLITILIFVQTIGMAQDTSIPPELIFEDVNMDTIPAYTEPATGYKSLQQQLEKVLSHGDTLGKRYRCHLNNIGFIVNKYGRIDSAWVIFYGRPLHIEVIKQLKLMEWKPAMKNGLPVATRDDLHIDLYLTKQVLKKYRCWPTFGERLFAPWLN